MSSNEPPEERFLLPPLPGIGDDPEPLAVPTSEADSADGPTGDPLMPPREAAFGDQPEEPEQPGIVGIASALEAVERLDAAEPDTQGPTGDALAPAQRDADERVFAAATTDFGGERPSYGIAERDFPAPAIDVLPPDDEPETGWPHFLRADAATETITAADERVLERTAEPVVMRVVEEKKKPTVARTLAEIPILLIIAAVIAFLVKTFLAQAYYIPSGSMLPQLQIDDRVVVSKLAYKAHDPRRGDIVVFDDPRTGASTTEGEVERSGLSKVIRAVGEGVGLIQPSTDEFIKRVIGLPGDTVEAHDGDVYVNGKRLVEPYLPEGVETSDFAPQVVEEGRVWVMGDNRSGSADSRVFGQIRTSSIVGRAMVKVWPFNHISFL